LILTLQHFAGREIQRGIEELNLKAKEEAVRFLKAILRMFRKRTLADLTPLQRVLALSLRRVL
jgi:hypothetical protein